MSERRQRFTPFDVRAVDEKARTVQLSFSSESRDVLRYDFEQNAAVPEILSHADGACDLTPWLNAGSVLRNHDPNQIVGVPVEASVDGAAVAALKFSSKVLGHMFKPEDKVVLDITAECTKPLPEQYRTVVCVLRDYWGAEFSEPINVKLEKAAGAKGKRCYTGSLDLSGLKLEHGKYYEVCGAITEPDLPEPYTDKSTFVIVPEAVTRKYKPTEIPFTSRDWDDKIKEYFFLSRQAESSGLSLGWAVGKPKPGINNPVAANVAAQSPDAEPVEDLQPEVANV